MRDYQNLNDLYCIDNWTSQVTFKCPHNLVTFLYEHNSKKKSKKKKETETHGRVTSNQRAKSSFNLDEVQPLYSLF